MVLIEKGRKVNFCGKNSELRMTLGTDFEEKRMLEKKYKDGRGMREGKVEMMWKKRQWERGIKEEICMIVIMEKIDILCGNDFRWYGEYITMCLMVIWIINWIFWVV